jgi:hypothetical protein
MDRVIAMTMKRYSVWGKEYGSDHDVELIQVDGNPQCVLDGLAAKTLAIKKKQSKLRRYSGLRIVENVE